MKDNLDNNPEGGEYNREEGRDGEKNLRGNGWVPCTSKLGLFFLNTLCKNGEEEERTPKIIV